MTPSDIDGVYMDTLIAAMRTQVQSINYAQEVRQFLLKLQDQGIRRPDYWGPDCNWGIEFRWYARQDYMRLRSPDVRVNINRERRDRVGGRIIASVTADLNSEPGQQRECKLDDLPGNIVYRVAGEMVQEMDRREREKEQDDEQADRQGKG